MAEVGARVDSAKSDVVGRAAAISHQIVSVPALIVHWATIGARIVGVG